MCNFQGVEIDDWCNFSKGSHKKILLSLPPCIIPLRQDAHIQVLHHNKGKSKEECANHLGILAVEKRRNVELAAQSTRSTNSPCRTFREVSCAAKAAFRVRRHGETRRGRRRFHGCRGNASKPAVESTTPIADRRFAMPPCSWSRVAQLHPQNSLKSQISAICHLRTMVALKFSR